LSPGLPGTTTSFSPEHATDPDGADEKKGPRNQGQGGRGEDPPGHDAQDPGSSDDSPGKGKAKGHDKDKARGKAKGHDREPGEGNRQDGPRGSGGGDRGADDDPAGPSSDEDRPGDQQRPTH
jgi:hypothetical protein